MTEEEKKAKELKELMKMSEAHIDLDSAEETKKWIVDRMKTLNNIQEFVARNFPSYKDIWYRSCDLISFTIAIYAHRNQKRLSNDTYANHSLDLRKMYTKLVGDDIDNKSKTDKWQQFKLPFYGVSEVALLHDVIEHTDVTLDDIRYIFHKFDCLALHLGFFEKPLLLITHNKKDSYETYIKAVSKSSTASFVKMLDMQDNLNMFTLDKFGDEEVNKCITYIKCSKILNDQYHFIEKINAYRKDERK